MCRISQIPKWFRNGGWPMRLHHPALGCAPGLDGRDLAGVLAALMPVPACSVVICTCKKLSSDLSNLKTVGIARESAGKGRLERR